MIVTILKPRFREHAALLLARRNTNGEESKNGDVASDTSTATSTRRYTATPLPEKPPAIIVFNCHLKAGFDAKRRFQQVRRIDRDIVESVTWP